MLPRNGSGSQLLQVTHLDAVMQFGVGLRPTKAILAPQLSWTLDEDGQLRDVRRLRGRQVEQNFLPDY